MVLSLWVDLCGSAGGGRTAPVLLRRSEEEGESTPEPYAELLVVGNSPAPTRSRGGGEAEEAGMPARPGESRNLRAPSRIELTAVGKPAGGMSAEVRIGVGAGAPAPPA